MTELLKSARLLLLAGLLVGCQPAKEVAPVEFVVPVTVTKVTSETVEDLIVTTGTVRAKELIKLTVLSSGLLEMGKGEHGRLAEGDKVSKGLVVAKVTGEDVRLSVKKELAKQRLEESKVNLDATSQLFKRNLISATVYERDKTSMENAKLEYETSLHSENRAKLVSPIDGVILTLARDKGQPMADGQMLNSGQVVAEIADLNEVIADVYLVGKDIAQVKTGQQARVNFHAWQEQSFAGSLLRLSPVIDERTRSVRAEVKINNPDMQLKPGMFVEVSIVTERKEGVAAVPRRAITQRGARQVVFVINGQRAEQRVVETGLENDQFVEILSGVEVDESVVILGLETLTDKMPVRVTGS